MTPPSHSRFIYIVSGLWYKCKDFVFKILLAIQKLHFHSIIHWDI